MVYFIDVVNPKYASYAIGLPNDITCWHFQKKNIKPEEALHIILITNRAMKREAYSNAEIEVGWLEAPEKAKRRRAARKGWLKRKYGI